MRRPNHSPVDYRLCNQRVTVYHQTGGSYSRRVFPHAFFDFKKAQSVDKTGNRESNSFLLVIPGESQAVFAGDKVFLGEGPEISTREEWASFIPAKISGLAVVSYADPKYWNGKLVHTEAGG